MTQPPPDIASYPRKRAADALGCSQRTVDRLVQAGELKAYRLRERGIRITQTSLREYIEKQRIVTDRPEGGVA
jgi:excisionase family DNA binding protein